VLIEEEERKNLSYMPTGLYLVLKYIPSLLSYTPLITTQFIPSILWRYNREPQYFIAVFSFYFLTSHGCSNPHSQAVYTENNISLYSSPRQNPMAETEVAVSSPYKKLHPRFYPPHPPCGTSVPRHNTTLRRRYKDHQKQILKNIQFWLFVLSSSEWSDFSSAHKANPHMCDVKRWHPQL